MKIIIISSFFPSYSMVCTDAVVPKLLESSKEKIPLRKIIPESYTNQANAIPIISQNLT